MEWVKITAMLQTLQGQTKSLDHSRCQGQDHEARENPEAGKIADKRVLGWKL